MHIQLTARERALYARLNTPEKVQRYLNEDSFITRSRMARPAAGPAG